MKASATRGPAWADRWGPLIAVATLIVFFLPIISGRFVYFLDDLKVIYYPLELAYAQFQNQGELPLWNNLFGFGHPLLAWGQLGFFTPLHVLLRVFQLDPAVLLQVSVVSYFAIGLAGFYTFLRRHTLVPVAAALGATAYVFSGFSIGHLNHVNFYVGTMVLPWLLVAIHVFLDSPSLRRSLWMVLASAAIIVSAQPQISLYCLIIAGSYGFVLTFAKLGTVATREGRSPATRYAARTIGLTLLAAGLAFALSSLAILPLLEFLPFTERGADLPVAELFDFSYVPSHAITLLLPYFFGDHESYWGAKGFQELAAFTGIIPLMLTGVALLTWRHMKPLRIWALLLILSAILMATGEYSPLYQYLVTNHILTSLTIPGRFVLFFNVGVAILAALGLHQLVRAKEYHRGTYTLAAVTVPLVVLLPFIWRAISDTRVANTLHRLVTGGDLFVVLGVVGGLGLIGILLLGKVRKDREALAIMLISCLTLLAMSWSYNPRTDTRATNTVFQNALSSYHEQVGVPARVYTRDSLLADDPLFFSKPTAKLTPTLTIMQPLGDVDITDDCISLPLYTEADAAGAVIVGLHDHLTAAAREQVVIQAKDVAQQPNQVVCFESLEASTLSNDVLSISAAEDTSINAYYVPSLDQPSGYFIRVAQPTRAELERSQKQLALAIRPVQLPGSDPEVMLLARHLNVEAGASSARWIGALAIKPYRDFIEFFLGNDSDQLVDGDGQHIVVSQRSHFDAAGVTHLAQRIAPGIRDTMSEAGFTPHAEVDESGIVYRLYTNPQAFPKAYTVPTAQFVPAADDARRILNSPDFDFQQAVLITGPQPPPDSALEQPASTASAEMVRYEHTEVEIHVTAENPTWLVVTDATTPQWHTTIDGESAPYYVANTAFKAAFVPAGVHTVVFQYQSDAADLAVRLSLLGVLLWLVLFAGSYVLGRSAPQDSSPPHTS